MAAWVEFAVVVLGVSAVAMGVVWVVDRIRGPRTSNSDDDRTGVKIGAAFGVYGMILGFAVVLAQQSYVDAESALQDEMGAVTSVIHVAQALPPEQGQPILDDMGRYLRVEIDNWDTLSQEDSESESLTYLKDLYTHVQRLSPDMTAAQPQAQLLASLAAIDLGRANRVIIADDGSVVFMRVLLLGGALLVIAMAALLNFESVRLRNILVVSMALLIGVALFAYWALANPFGGPIPINSGPLVRVLQNLQL